jgi:HEAT repeat protein
MPLIRKPPSGSSVPLPSPPFDAAALSDASSDVRWATVRAASSRPDAVTLLGAALPRERDPRVREAIFSGLAQIATEESAGIVVPHLRSEDASVRRGALAALSVMPAATASYLPALVTDKDPDVRLLSCELARFQPAATANRILCAVLDADPEKNVCAAALDVLAETGGPEILASLDRCAQRFRDDPFLSFSIDVVRQQIGTQPASARE